MIYLVNYYYELYVDGKVDGTNYETDLNMLQNKCVWKFFYFNNGSKVAMRKPVYGKVIADREDGPYAYYHYKFHPVKKDGTFAKKGSYLASSFYADTEEEAIEEFNRICQLYISEYKQVIEDIEKRML